MANSPLEAVWVAMATLPRPITAEQALDAGVKVCRELGKSVSQFESWFDTEKRTVMDQLNK